MDKHKKIHQSGVNASYQIVPFYQIYRENQMAEEDISLTNIDS